MSALIAALFTNWKTTLLGFLGAIVLAAQGYFSTQPGAWPYVGAAIVAIFGLVAKDSNVTGGTKPTPPPTP
jgi:hypothetical protein